MSRIITRVVKIAAVFSLFCLTTSAAYAGSAYEGYTLFNQTCFLCHGTSGKGDGPLADKLDMSPSDLTSDGKTDDERLFGLIKGTIAHGSEKSAMPKWGLAMPENQIRSLMAYIRFLQNSKHALPGDPEMGQAVYMDRCVACHGRGGMGDGPLTELLTMNAQNLTDGSELNKHPNSELIHIITNGTPGKTLMPGWKGILSEEEIAGVLSYVRLLAK
ncbi:MAG: c-type cytochrome [Candidatus Thiodiazotropha taylori]|nr:c-type cytochrome [Candidatus Thiodiazotropha taylori]MCG7911704.1 c-type cytochrome [Candidatus Thiodiazotropha taylori]MCG7944344.1 c-type cytochrome [Candidatus Thiodiazotropha taylori]MCG8029630.1 c-type cytochrome [Candidatus Thiodiazotropha taylori]MCG8107166.1 c-type cytochrome [Candidatus Thiodiazotropha taylori]